jgi:DNA-binding HxlR family transcriptional regulator
MITLTAHLQKYGMKRCPINNSIKMIGKKFALHILRNMILLKQKRFSQFLGSIEGISTKTLSIRLHEMEKEGLITREVISTKPVQIEYSLTKKGEMFEPVLKLLGEFSVMYEPAVIFKDGKPRGPEGVFGRNVRLSSLYEY